jgi:tetratricopeptide (TPR) repeat protein
MRTTAIVACAVALSSSACSGGAHSLASRGAAAPVFGPPRDLEGRLVAQRHAAPDDLRAGFLLALVREMRGRPGDALETALDVLGRAARSSDPLAPDISEALAHVLEDLDDVAPGHARRVVPVARRLLEHPGALGPEAVHVLAELLYRTGSRIGDEELALAALARTGCVTRVAVAGPFGPFRLLGFDEQLAPEEPGPWAAAYDLGGGRGVVPVREVVARGCALNVGGVVPMGGTFYVAGAVELVAPTEVLVRLETPNAAKLLVDDEVVFTRDSFDRPLSRVDTVRLALPAGRTELTVKVTTQHPNPVIVLSLLDARSLEPVGDADPASPAPLSPGARLLADLAAAGSLAGLVVTAAAAAGAPPAADRPVSWGLVPWEGMPLFERLLASVVGVARGDVVGAREALRTMSRAEGAPAVVTALAAVAALQDPAIPEDARRDRARRLLRRTRDRDPDLWVATYQLARLEMAEERTARAVELLREGIRRHPKQIEFPLLLSDLYAGEGWESDALAVAEAARAVDPDACRPLQALLVLRRRANAVSAAEALAERLARCDRTSDAAFGAAVQARRYREAVAEARRLLARAPDSTALLGALAEAQRGAGDLEGSAATMERMLALRPGYADVAQRRADLRIALVGTGVAEEDLARALALQPGEMATLRRPLALLQGRAPMQPYRLDGRDVVRAFEASGRTYEAPAVLVLDYTVVRLFDDGSSLELTHNVIRVQSPEGIERYGEFEPPAGAELLVVRTVKADGTLLEPEEIAGKESLSLPNLAPGDYVEYEYLVSREPPQSFPGGVMGERFYFRSFDTPFDRSELHVVAPRDLELEVDPRGPAPRPEVEAAGPLRILHFRAAQMRPLVAEPRAVSSREFLPSVQISRGARWDVYVDGVRDGLRDRARRDPELDRLARRVAGPPDARGPEERARRLYGWVLGEIEDTGDPFAQASEIVASRSGNRARALHALLSAAGIPASLALVRDLGADRTPTRVASSDTYEHLLLRVDLPGGPRWLSTLEDGAPFGYLPSVLRGQEALALATGAPRWTTAAQIPGGDARSISIELALSAEGGGEATVVETCRGAPAVAWRRILRQIPAAELDRRFEQLYLGRVVAGAEVVDLRIEGQEDPEAALVLRYRWRAPAVARRADGRLFLPALYATLLSPDLARLPARSVEMIVDDVVDMRFAAHVRAPVGFSLDETSPDVGIEGAFGRFRSTIRADGDGGVRIERTLAISPRRVDPERYPAFASFCRSVDQAQLAEIPLVRTAD